MRHPDTLADGVAEAISRAYNRYCLEEFGAEPGPVISGTFRPAPA
ncbi:hypothetical protein [Streptomyces adustus]